MGISATSSPEQRQIRVFLSSTFVDFLEERELLTKRVFPALNRRARDRGVELVDVDLRWGVTEEQTRQGQTLPLCLGEIDRCRPYFIGLLGERHGWVPPAEFYRPELLERQPWLKQHQGGASVTELEILHGVLRNPEMAGDARFYLRDPAYALAQQDPAWLAQGEEERQRLEALKQQVRASGFPMVEGLADPEAIASRIEADLWQLIEERFPEQEPPDALAREELKHASYRQARLGVYLDAAGNVQKLEDLIASGEQQILITGESGSGKSALIANWMQRHHQLHPQDHIHAHHLGCTNDSNAIRPLLARLIETASGLLEADGLISEPTKVPQDWWDLVAKVAETLQDLGRWVRTNNCRWILVLDGLDRLPAEDQNALPWLPPMIPACVHLVITALDCNARLILQQRGFMGLEIGQLQRSEQQQLIDSYLGRYTKQLEAGLEEQILRHPLANSPLFLRVLLEELRQCGRFDTLKQQLDFYLSATTIDALYEWVLERLENDGHGDVVRNVMTALWASRAGLTETELLAITGLAPLEWAPIDLALEKAFGHNGNRLVFDHDFLRTAVEHRYLQNDGARREAHGALADWFGCREGWDERDAEEWPWQLQQAERREELRDLLLTPGLLANLVWDRDSREVLNYWRLARADGDGELDEVIAEKLEEEIEKRRRDTDDLIWLVDRIANIFEDAGLYRKPLLRLRALSLELEQNSDGRNEESILTSLAWLANAHRMLGDFDAAQMLCENCLRGRERLLGPEHPDTLATVGNLGNIYMAKGNYGKAEACYQRSLEARERLLGREHPDTLISVGNLGSVYRAIGDYERAEACYQRSLEAQERLLGPEHPDTLTTISSLGSLLMDKGNYDKAEACYQRSLEAQERLLGPEHPDTLTTVCNLGLLYSEMGNYERAEAYYLRDLEASERLLGTEHPGTLATVGNLGLLYANKEDYAKAEELYLRVLEASERLLGPEHPDTLATIGNLALLYGDKGDFEKAESCYTRALEISERILGAEHPDTNSFQFLLAELLSDQERYEESIPLRRRELTWCCQYHGDTDPDTLHSINQLAIDLRESGALEEAENLFRELLASRQRVLKHGEFEIGRTLGGLAKTLEQAGKLEEALSFRQQALAYWLEHEGLHASLTNRGRFFLARVLHKMGRYSEALTHLQQLEDSLSRLQDPDDNVKMLINEADELRRLITLAS